MGPRQLREQRRLDCRGAPGSHKRPSHRHPRHRERQVVPDRVEAEVLAAADRDGMEVRIRMETPKGDSGVTALHYENLLHHRDFAGWPVKGKKTERAAIMSGSHKKGKLLIALGAAWDEALVAEFERFPYGSHDDQVDACSLAFNQLWEFGGATPP